MSMIPRYRMILCGGHLSCFVSCMWRSCGFLRFSSFFTLYNVINMQPKQVSRFWHSIAQTPQFGARMCFCGSYIDNNFQISIFYQNTRLNWGRNGDFQLWNFFNYLSDKAMDKYQALVKITFVKTECNKIDDYIERITCWRFKFSKRCTRKM